MKIVVHAADALSRAGLSGLLDAVPGTEIVASWVDADVAVVAADRLRHDVVSMLRAEAVRAEVPVVLVVPELTDAELLTAIECRVMAVLPRTALTEDRLWHCVRTALAGGGVIPPSLVGGLLKHMGRFQREVLAPHGLNASGLTEREIDVLRLMAEGLETPEIAAKLCYSERTVKNVLYGVTHRLKLKSRSHAVAYAMRAGVF
ncbi:helix-turn-helix transcriptional regulator [Jidongwangia harbinensis]|uniref:helix-turn-helix transcriptional regulator n=1 Tax=Jidongwangia harbinensis TaxID=2878561 RepID=UPI001CD9293A|nr:response regulator transcription factor [Jidongwangia harbinensis]MCA2214467.1 response regulator transcription factor [Jidongwangia harbinensis]